MIAPSAKQVECLLLGDERTPVLVVDGVDEFTLELQRSARKADFKPDRKSMYPGLRAQMPRDVSIAILQSVYRQLYRIYRIPQTLRLKPKQACFSLVTSPSETLTPMQRIPHFDTSDPYFFALLIYLNPGPHGATGFFRHVPTGFERIGHERVEDYLVEASNFNSRHGTPAPRYQNTSSDQYKLYRQVEYVQHRMVIYPGNLLHSILVDEKRDIDPMPSSGRLTANIFFEFS